MKHHAKHVRLVSLIPEMAQTNFQALLNFKADVLARFESLQRSMQWGVSFKGGTTTT